MTYNLSNPQKDDIEVDFFNSLPSEFQWDTNYVVFTGGADELD